MLPVTYFPITFLLLVKLISDIMFPGFKTMWPFRKKTENKKGRSIRTIVAGVIFGAAIASIIGKKILEKHEKEDDLEEEEEKR